MAEPDFSVTTPDWMKQGRDVGDEWLRMQAGNQNQRRVNLQEQEQNALLPLKMREYQQKSQLDGLRLQDEFKKRQDIIDAEIAAQELARGPIADLLKAGKAEEALNAFLEAGIRNPNLRKSKAYGEMSDDLRFTLQVKENARLRQSGYYGAPPREAKLGALYQKAVDEGDEHMAGVYKAALDSETIKQKNAGTRIEQAGQRIVREETKLQKDLAEGGYEAKTNADGTVTLIPKERPLTTGTVSDLQKQNAKLDNSISNVQYAIKQIEAHPEAFGPRGWVGEWAERFQGMVDPNAPMTTTGARTTAGEAAHDLIVSLKTDPQVSNFERNAIDEVVGKPSEFFTNPARVKEKFQVLLEIGTARRIRQGAALKQAPSMSDLDIITDPEHIKSLAREGTLSKEQALEWARRHLPTQ